MELLTDGRRLQPLAISLFFAYQWGPKHGNNYYNWWFVECVVSSPQ